MLILEQWPRQIAPAARGTLASNFRALKRLDQPAGQPSQLSWATPVKVVSRLAWGASTWHWDPAAQLLLPALLPVCGRLGPLPCSLVVLCQVRVPRTGPGSAGRWRLGDRGRKAVRRLGAEMGTETCLLRARPVKGPAGEHRAPPAPPSVAPAIN